MNKHLNKFIIAGFSLMAFACDKDDFTGDSTLTPTNPTIDIEVEDSDVSFLEKDSTFTFTLTLSEPQISDVAVYVTQVAGDATMGEDFTLGSDVVIIPANTTSAVATVSVAADDIPEGTETFTIQIGDSRTANADITPATVQFTISNATASDLELSLSWNAELYDASGAAIPPASIADLIFYITEPDGTIIETVDGAAFESFLIEGDNFPDGEYLIKVGIYDRVNPGDLGEIPLLDIMLEYYQPGVYAPTTLSFPLSFNSEYVCDNNLVTLASITKTGTTYSIEKLGMPPVVADGNWTGVDGNLDGIGWEGAGDTQIAMVDGVYTIDGLNQDFMVNIWGETIEESVPVVFTVDQTGNITIADQYIFTTMYDGSLYDYHISGTGTLNPCDGSIELNYEMSQDGFLVGDWLNTNGYMSDEVFKATLNLN